ncbi:alpha-keto acid decarboxylase family protein [bacterium]|nr:alpha-keto acid decarboxylase family protein [bacterium]
MNTAEYLVKKLEELGIIEFFGVPGDYNFNIIRAIDNNSSTKWIGCTNELNAAYAADGYARQRGYGAVVTTFGVGELSAINGIAGSYAENVPVIHIVGVPTTNSIASKKLLHHNLFNLDSFAYVNAYEHVTETTAFLNRDNSKLEIDRVLKIFIKYKKPVYIAIPVDIAQMEISSREVDYSWSSDEEVLNRAVKNILEKINNSSKPVILADVLTKRYDSKIELNEFIAKSGIPATNFLMGIGLIDKEFSNYLGTYFSKYKNPVAQKFLESTDCLIAVGTVYTELNSFGFDLPYKINSHIAIYGTYTYVDGVKYDNIKMSDVLENLAENIEHKVFLSEKNNYCYENTPATTNKLTSEYIYSRIQEFFKDNDIFYSDIGVITQGVATIDYPSKFDFNLQALWASIGWATPAAFGAALACPKNRVILLTGDGAHQVSAMELGNMLRYGLKPIIIVLNNNGYSLERVLSNDDNDNFNDIVKVNYSKFARVFEGDVWAIKVETEDDFDKALKVSQIMNKLCYIEVVTSELDIPELTTSLIKNLNIASKADVKQENTVVMKIREESVKIKNNNNLSFNTKIHESLRKD